MQTSSSGGGGVNAAGDAGLLGTGDGSGAAQTRRQQRQRLQRQILEGMQVVGFRPLSVVSLLEFLLRFDWVPSLSLVHMDPTFEHLAECILRHGGSDAWNRGNRT